MKKIKIKIYQSQF